MRVISRNNRGAAVVEFAIILPLLIVIVFGIIEFGFLWLQSHYIANSAREGSRIAATLPNIDDPGSGSSYVRDGVINHLQGLGLGLYGDLDNNNNSEIHFINFGDSIPAPGEFVSIVVEEGDLTNFGGNPIGTTPEPAAVRVWVTVQTHLVWKPILWGLLAGLPFFGNTDITLDEITETAVFVRQFAP